MSPSPTGIISRRVKNILFYAYKKGYVTFSRQKLFGYPSRISFSINMMALEHLGLMYDSETRDKNYEKVWKITDLGRRFVELLMEMENAQKTE